MNIIKSAALNVTGLRTSKHWIWGIFAAAVMAATTLPSTAANLIAHYPLDSFYYAGGGSSGVPYTTNTAPGSTWGDARLNYTGLQLWGGEFTNAIFGNGFIETNGAAAQILFGTMDPFAATGSFTYALWVWDPFTTTPGLQSMLLSKQNSNTDHYFRIILRADNGGSNTNLDNMEIGAYFGAQQNRVSGTISPDPSQRWVHIAVTGSKSGDVATWKVYTDGVQRTVSNGGTNTLDATKAAIGMTCGVTAGNQFQAYPNLIVDDIRFYDGALTAAEILAIPGVTPVSASVGVTNGVVTVSWNSFIGNRYQPEKTTDLASPSWTDVGSTVTATTTNTSVSESVGVNPTFYRVKVLP